MLSNFSSNNNRTEKEVVYIIHHFVPELMEVSK